MTSVPLRRSSNPMTVASTTRETPTGRTIRYDLTVIQQPERARACGSGAKSSADRRPVDPPPVVELRVFEQLGDKWEDITFAYGANFFLFATLEVARQMAHGRVQQPAAPQCPVLTGMPVSGMAYLDRPKEAGYFIFPDLSVRHEGMYILSFNLYEETRPDSEQDVKASKSMGSNVMSPDASFDWRLEIKSEMFQVYSAKKFPGLAESTSLSRIVAEQGCRVRIRRDVRMRRRDGKSNGDEGQEENYHSSRPIHEDGQARGRADYRSDNGGHSAGSSPERPLAQKPENGYLGAALDKPAAPHFATPNQFPQQQGQHSYAPPPIAYQQQQAPPYSNHGYVQPPTAQPGYGREWPASAVENRSEREYENPEFRRASYASGQPTYPYQHAPLPPTADSSFRAPFQEYPRMPAAQLPPLSLEKRDTLVPSSPLAPINVAPLRSFANERSERHYPYSGQPLAPAPAPLTPSLAEEPMRNGRKRTHNSVFTSSSVSQSLYNGMRPDSEHGDNPDVDEEEDEGKIDMVYKRANGNNYQRILPQLS